MKQFLMEKIEGNEARIKGLNEENDKLRQELKEKGDIKGIEKWVGFEFESSAGVTEEWDAFVRDFKKHIKSQLPDGAELVNFSKGHFEFSGFVKMGERYVYFSISDVRYWKDGWYINILIRTAKSIGDYIGGSNSSTTLKDFKKNVNYLLQEGL